MAKVLTALQQKFLDILFDEAKGDFNVAKRLAGYSDGTPTASVISSLKEEIIEQAHLFLAMNAPKAAMAMVGIIDDPTEFGASEKRQAASQVLDRVGVIKHEQVDVNMKGNSGIFILPEKQLLNAAKKDPENTEEASV